MTRDSSRGRIRVAIFNDYEVVIAGLAAALQPYSDRIEIVELDSGVTPAAEVDVVLYDTFGQVQGDQIDLARFDQSGDAAVVIFSWNVDQALVRDALAKGASGYVAKSVTAADLVESIEAVHRGQQVARISEEIDDFGRWPGESKGLSNRESEVLALITQGLSNNEICERTYLSPNTLKTYIRNLYQKIGATRRTDAVLWGAEHGFRPDRLRRRLAP